MKVIYKVTLLREICEDSDYITDKTWYYMNKKDAESHYETLSQDLVHISTILAFNKGENKEVIK
jgi:hypothetical protein